MCVHRKAPCPWSVQAICLSIRKQERTLADAGSSRSTSLFPCKKAWGCLSTLTSHNPCQPSAVPSKLSASSAAHWTGLSSQASGQGPQARRPAHNQQEYVRYAVSCQQALGLGTEVRRHDPPSGKEPTPPRTGGLLLKTVPPMASRTAPRPPDRCA